MLSQVIVTLILIFLFIMQFVRVFRKKIGEVVQKIEKIKKGVDKIVSILPRWGWGLIALGLIGVILYALPIRLTLTILLGVLGIAIFVITLVICYRRELSWWCILIIVGEFILGVALCYAAFRSSLFLHPGDGLWVEVGADVAMLATLVLGWFY